MISFRIKRPLKEVRPAPGLRMIHPVGRWKDLSTTTASTHIRTTLKGFTPPLKNITYIKLLGELILGSLHNFHVFHCVSRNYVWKSRFLCVIHGLAITKTKFGEIISVSLHKPYVMRSRPLHKISLGKCFVYDFGGGCINMNSNVGSSALARGRSHLL